MLISRFEFSLIAGGVVGVDERLAYGVVTGGVERTHFLDADGLLLLDTKRQGLLDVTVHLVHPALSADHLVMAVDPRARRLSDVDVGLPSLHQERNIIGPRRSAVYSIQMMILELAVAGHAPIEYASLER